MCVCEKFKSAQNVMGSLKNALQFFCPTLPLIRGWWCQFQLCPPDSTSGGEGGLVFQNALQHDYISRCKPPVPPFDNRGAD